VRAGPRPVLIALALLAALALHVPGTARADGDPASDQLIFKTLYTPVSEKISPPVLRQLQATIAGANAAGVKVRVALILDRSDLGAVPQLLGHPLEYAHLLAGELTFAWKGGIVAVQPGGIGVRNFTPLAPAQKVADGVAIARPVTADSLAIAADTTIRRLAARAGTTLAGGSASPGASSGSGTSTTWIIGGVALAVLVLAGAGIAALRLRRRPAPQPPEAVSRRSSGAGRPRSRRR
jgi:hypothetical protein